jgi:hypothetical protein
VCVKLWKRRIGTKKKRKKETERKSNMRSSWKR